MASLTAICTSCWVKVSSSRSTWTYSRLPRRDQRQLVLPVGDDYFCRSQRVIIRYRRCRIGYGSASRNIEAKTNGRKDATDGGGDGRDERALCPQVAARPVAVGDQDRAPVAHPSQTPSKGVWAEEILPLLQGEAAGGLRATTIIEWLEEKFPWQVQRLASPHPATATTRLAGTQRPGPGGLLPPGASPRAARPSWTSPTATPWE